MISQCLVPSITKKVSFYSLVLEQQPTAALQIQSFHESISMHLKIIGNVFSSKLFVE